MLDAWQQSIREVAAQGLVHGPPEDWREADGHLRLVRNLAGRWRWGPGGLLRRDRPRQNRGDRSEGGEQRLSSRIALHAGPLSGPIHPRRHPPGTVGTKNAPPDAAKRDGLRASGGHPTHSGGALAVLRDGATAQ